MFKYAKNLSYATVIMLREDKKPGTSQFYEFDLNYVRGVIYELSEKHGTCKNIRITHSTIEIYYSNRREKQRAIETAKELCGNKFRQRIVKNLFARKLNSKAAEFIEYNTRLLTMKPE